MYASTHPWRSAAVSLFGAAGLALAIGLGTAMDTGAPALNLASDAAAMPSAKPLTAEPASTELDVPAADGVRVPASSPSDPSPVDPSPSDLALSDPALFGPTAPASSPSSPSPSPSLSEPSLSEPSLSEPSLSEPSTAEPSTDEPSTAEPVSPAGAAPEEAEPASPAGAAPEAAQEPAAVESVAAPTPTASNNQPMVGPPMPTNGDTDCADYTRQSFPIDPANDPNNLDADGDGIACEPPPGSRESEDLDCADVAERSFRIDPANDPNNFDADGDGIACEPPPGE
ncbi:hypothetical protein [Phytohabitans houttuyneae]|nr:hypothetical protein [Phytohabitans houttuyneae]